MIYFTEVEAEEKETPQFGYCVEAGKLKIKVTFEGDITLDVDGKSTKLTEGDLLVIAEQLPDLIDFYQHTTD